MIRIITVQRPHSTRSTTTGRARVLGRLSIVRSSIRSDDRGDAEAEVMQNLKLRRVEGIANAIHPIDWTDEPGQQSALIDLSHFCPLEH